MFDKDNYTSHGSSGFANYWGIRKLLKSNHRGIYLANDLRLNADTSCMHSVLVGPSGSFKSTAFSFNNLLRPWKQPVGLVIFDPDGAAYKASKTYMQSQGFQILKVDLNHPHESACFNPLLGLTNKHSAREMAQTLVEGVYKDHKGDPFWSESATLILGIMLLAMIRQVPAEQRTLYFLTQLINKFNPTTQEEVDAFVEQALENDPDTFQEYVAFNAASFKVKQSILSTVKSCLYSFSDETMQHICARNSFTFSQLRSGKTALFLIQREDRIPYNRAFWALLFNSLFSELMLGDRDAQPVYCFLDEFASYKVPNFTAIISTIRRRRVGLHLILQSVEQLYDMYGQQQAKVIIENCATKLFLSGLSHESSKLVSDLLGNRTTTYSQKSSKGIFSMDTSPKYRTARPLLTPDEVRRLKAGQVLIVHRNHRPMLLKQQPYFKNKTLKRRSKS